jgi:hypothetical protein
MNVREWEEQQLEKRFGVIPAQCPACSEQTVRLIWHLGHCYGGPIKSSVDAGKALLVGDQKPPGGPAWACLACQPGWLTVHQLTFDVEALQIKLENAVAESDFETAKQYRSLREDVQSALSAIFLHWSKRFLAGFRAFSKSWWGLAASGISQYCPTDRVFPRFSGVRV